MAMTATGNEIQIPTARGDAIPSGSLGTTLMHEHTFNISTEFNLNWPETWGDEEERVSDAVGQYTELKQAGVDTIVDVTCIGLGRFIPRIQRIAKEVDLNIVVATGFYTWHELPMFFKWKGDVSDGFAGKVPETMDDLFVRDIEEGIGGTDVRAGIIKVATDKFGVTDGVEHTLRAAARAHRRTGTPITTHTHDVPNGTDQQKVFEDEGVDLSRVVIGHVDIAASHDMSYVEEILGKGSFVGVDQFGVPSVTNEQRMDAIVELCDKGYAGQIVLSHDHNCFCDMVPMDWFTAMVDWRKTFIVQEVLPGLRDKGVTEEQITAMTVDNPRKILETASLGTY
jgi:phosphotriesterase-related protein